MTMTMYYHSFTHQIHIRPICDCSSRQSPFALCLYMRVRDRRAVAQTTMIAR